MTTNFANMYISHILEWVLFIVYNFTSIWDQRLH